MPVDYANNQHPRIEERKFEKPIKVRDQAQVGEGFFARLNAKVGLKITLVVGTMWAAYAFALIALLSLPSTISSGSLFEIVVWISSSFLQLVLLPIIIVGQNIQARAADKRSEATYKDADAVLHEAREIQKHLKAQDAEIERILGLLNDRLNASEGSAS